MRRLLSRRASAVAGLAAMVLGGAGSALAAAPPARPDKARPAAVRAHLTAARLRPAPEGYVPAAPPARASLKSAARRAKRLPAVVLPDLFAVAAHSMTPAELAAIAKLRHVRQVLAVAGGSVSISGHAVGTIGVSASAFRAWTPAQTAAQQGIWTALGHGELVTTATEATTLGLRGGHRYQVSGASAPVVTFGGTAALGIPGVDAVVSNRTSRALGLVPQIGVLISAPRADLATLDAQIRAITGQPTRFVSLRTVRQAPVQRAQTQLNAPSTISPGRPTSWLQLFQDSAAKYCPGLPWTVLAAIGQIESGDGQNNGPSPAGALGPMQFMPSTWARWGLTTPWATTGPPDDINNPFDAVPAAALYLCASGASQGSAGLDAAIFSYNHAAWYVAEVLALAREYAQQYG